jgi:hypothetical protein
MSSWPASPRGPSRFPYKFITYGGLHIVSLFEYNIHRLLSWVLILMDLNPNISQTVAKLSVGRGLALPYLAIESFYGELLYAAFSGKTRRRRVPFGTNGLGHISRQPIISVTQTSISHVTYERCAIKNVTYEWLFLTMYEHFFYDNGGTTFCFELGFLLFLFPISAGYF